MGYTRYWYQNFWSKEYAEDFSKEFLSEVRQILKTASDVYGIKCGDWEGKGRPVVNKEVISLNGKEPNDHETFTIFSPKYYFKRLELKETSEDGFGFCKTARKPYDSVVCAILMLAQEKEYVRNVSNDGENNFGLAVALLNDAVNYPSSVSRKQEEN